MIMCLCVRIDLSILHDRGVEVILNYLNYSICEWLECLIYLSPIYWNVCNLHEFERTVFFAD